VRYTQFKAFEKHLQSSYPSNFLPLYCILIKDPAERGLAFDTLKKKLEASSLSHYDPQEVKALLGELDTLSMFAGKQLFHLHACEKLTKETQGLLEKRLASLPPSTTLVFSGESVPRQSAFFKALEKHGVILDTGEEKPWEKEKNLAEWLLEQARQAKIAIDPDAVNALARGTQGSLSLLSAEWEKLLTYVGEKPQITLSDVLAICLISTTDSTWAFGEAILAKDSKTALETSHRMLDAGVSVFPLLRGLRHQVMTALLMATAEREGKRDWISQKFPYLKGQMLEKQLHAASRFGVDRLSTAIQTIDDFEFKAKDGFDDAKLLLTLLCTRIIP
jgi:DNA polymerase-3 subunit delta